MQRFANVLTSAPARRKWVSDELAVVAESKKVAGDMITEAVLDQVRVNYIILVLWIHLSKCFIWIRLLT
jgi:hypothetical protein